MRYTWQYFENGMESELSKHLTALVSEYGKEVIIELAFCMMRNLADKEVIAEVLRCLGRMTDVLSKEFRREFLELGLLHTSVVIRDGAYVGLSSLRDPRTRRAIKESVERESNPDLRDDLQYLLDELEHAH